MSTKSDEMIRRVTADVVADLNRKLPEQLVPGKYSEVTVTIKIHDGTPNNVVTGVSENRQYKWRG